MRFEGRPELFRIVAARNGWIVMLRDADYGREVHDTMTTLVAHTTQELADIIKAEADKIEAPVQRGEKP